VATTMSERVRDLEEDSSSALEKLANKVNAHHLELVRRVKNRMVRLATRVETIRGLLEKYLGDDDDLAELHLTGRRYGSASLELCEWTPVVSALTAIRALEFNTKLISTRRASCSHVDLTTVRHGPLLGVSSGVIKVGTVVGVWSSGVVSFNQVSKRRIKKQTVWPHVVANRDARRIWLSCGPFRRNDVSECTRTAFRPACCH
jgi:hypothetical protein